MTENERLKDDLAYVRAAIDRQRQILCHAIPFWFAGLIAAFMVVLGAVGDLYRQGVLPESASDIVKLGGFVGLVTILLSRALRERRDRLTDGATRPRQRGQARQVVPFLIFVAGLAFIQIYASTAGIGGAAFKPVIIAYVAVSFMLLGHNGLRLLLWMGAGLAAATLVYVAFDSEFPRTILGVGFAAGILLGSWFDRRLLARAAG
ncbi:MAG: hypothetical protein D6807_01310 [Alphaproteobacteria bacterium]|nr:MAG: hypothetical protein D6807_01310 [Alphaproteobacteria bacterium]